MNNLEPNDAVLTKSHMERVQLIEQLKEAGIEISYNTWMDRHSQQAFNEYPIIYFPDGNITGRTMTESSFNALTMEDYLIKAGIGPKSKYYGNIIKHHFI